MNHYILEGHKPVPVRDLMTWGRWFETAYADFENALRVAHTTLVDGSRISTVFLGINHQWGKGPPLLFETCIFFDEGTATTHDFMGRIFAESEIQNRYSTWSEAELGHLKIVEALCVALHLPVVPKVEAQT